MRIIASNSLLASTSVALGRIGPVGLAFNGTPVVQIEQLFRDALATIFGRADGPVEFSFGIEAVFASHARALQFCALHREAVPLQSDVQLIDDDAGINLVLAGAVREIRFGQVQGCAVRVDYKFTGRQFTSEDIPEDLEEDTDRLKVGTTDPAVDAEEVVVVFVTPFAGIPRYVDLNLEFPSGQVPIAVSGYTDVTEAGFTAKLAFPIPTSGYKSRWQAVL